MSDWNIKAGGEYTFYGVYYAFYDKISKNWKAESTRIQYEGMYTGRILPNMKGHDRKGISEYVREDFDAVIEQIIYQGQGSDPMIYRGYAESTIKTFRRLIYDVVKVAAEEGLCDNVLWESCYNPQVSTDVEELIARNALLPKSLTVLQEKAVAEILLSLPVDAAGQEIGLLLMYAMGLRNAEACGMNFEDIKSMQSYQKCRVAWIYKTTAYDRNELKAKGKTPNADRIIPVPEVVAKYLASRKAYLEELVGESVDDYPIVCMGDQLKERCTPRHLTNAARKLFQTIKMDAAQLANIDEELRSADSPFTGKEKDPTAYIFRRNFGMHLHILGLSDAEIQYVIGHDIEDLYETRNEFVDEERLYRIYRKMAQRPLVNTDYLKEDAMAVHHGKIRDLTEHYGKIQVPADGTKVKLRLQTVEPLDEIKVRIAADNRKKKVKSEFERYSCEKTGYSRNIDVRRQYQKRYKMK